MTNTKDDNTGKTSSQLNYDLLITFDDPLMTNQFSVFASQNKDSLGLAGVGYSNNRYRLNFGGKVYGVYDSGDDPDLYDFDPVTNKYSNSSTIVQDSRDYGFAAFLALPLLRSGYNSINLVATYYQDYDNNQRSPLIASLDLDHREHYGKAIDYEFQHSFSLFGGNDRGDNSAGFNYRLSHAFPWKTFVGFSAKAVKSYYQEGANQTDQDKTRGIKFTNIQSSLVNDPAVVVMPSLSHTRYVEQASVAQIDFKKQFDYHILFFTFPLSLTQESLYVKQRYYDIVDYQQANNGDSLNYNETTIGASTDILILNTLTLPLNFEYILNDNTEEKGQFVMSINGSF